jgi:hypothetical protein
MICGVDSIPWNLYSVDVDYIGCGRIETLEQADFLVLPIFVRGIHPMKMFKMADVQGGDCLS